MTASSVAVRSPWTDEFIRIITSPLDEENVQTVAANLAAVHDKIPKTPKKKSDTRRAFLEQAGATKVLTFLQTDCRRYSQESTTLLKKARICIYMILRHLTGAGKVKKDVKECLVTSKVCDEVSRYICQNTRESNKDTVCISLINHGTFKALQTLLMLFLPESNNKYRNIFLLLFILQTTWLLVEVGMDLLYNCTIKMSSAVRNLLKPALQNCISEVTQLTDSTLLYRCVNLADAIGTDPPLVSGEHIKTWASWMSTFYFDQEIKKHYIKLPKPSISDTAVSTLFSAFNYAIVTDEQKHILIPALTLYMTVVEDVLIKGSDLAKYKISMLFLSLLHHNCSLCDTDFVRDILFNSGKSVQEVIQSSVMEEVNSSFSWISKHVPDMPCCYNLGVKLGLEHKTVKDVISDNSGLPLPHAATARDLLELWEKQSEGKDETVRLNQLYQALGVIKHLTQIGGSTTGSQRGK